MSKGRRNLATHVILIAILIGSVIQALAGAWTDGERLIVLGAIVRPWILQDGEYWRLLTAMFLHGNGTIPMTIAHLAMNLLALVQLGTIYENMFGTRRFVVIYFVAGLCASCVSLVFADGPSVGASGAIFGIFGAFITSVRRSARFREARAARSLVQQVIFWAGMNIAIGLQFEQVDNAAHIGGFVAGLLLGALLPDVTQPPPPAHAVVDVMPFNDWERGAPGADPGGRTDDRSPRE